MMPSAGTGAAAHAGPRACQICGNRQVRHLFSNAMAALGGLDLSYRVGQCTQCGFDFAYDLPPAATYQHYYETLSKYDVAAKVSGLDNLRFDGIVQLCRASLSSESVVVDIGCGEGALMAKLRSAGFSHVYGVDPAPNASAVAQQKYGLHTVGRGFFADAHTVAPLAQASGVCIAAVLEHLPNLQADLSALLAHLPPPCRLFIEVPTLELFGCQGAEPFGEFSLEHINFFCRETLSLLLARLGWVCAHSEYLAYPDMQTGSVISEFVRATVTPSLRSPAMPPQLDSYIADCQAMLNTVIARIPRGEIILYGAGSHSARILPVLQQSTEITVAAIVDGNRNLIGKSLGPWTIQSPSVLATMPGLPVVISSFRAQADIAASLQSHYANPVVLLY